MPCSDQSSLYRPYGHSKADQFKDAYIMQEGYRTVRQGFPDVEIGYPITVAEDRPGWRSRVGEQIGPFFFNPSLPWYGGRHFFTDKHHYSLSTPAVEYGKKTWNGSSSLHTVTDKDPSFMNGGFYPWGSNRNQYYEYLPQVTHTVPKPSPSKFEVRPDDVKKYLFGTRG